MLKLMKDNITPIDRKQNGEEMDALDLPGGRDLRGVFSTFDQLWYQPVPNKDFH